MSKLYVVVKATLSAGMKAAQAIHAFKAFGTAFPDVESDWFENSNNIVVLEHFDIDGVAHDLESLGLKLSKFHEPDLDGELTAFCVEPRAWRYLSNVRLAG